MCYLWNIQTFLFSFFYEEFYLSEPQSVVWTQQYTTFKEEMSLCRNF